jgi:hypothetical protein
VHNQNLKRQGLPTTEEQEKLDILKKAWNAEGSPFKGTPFDPSKLNLPGGSMGGMGGMPPGMPPGMMMPPGMPGMPGRPGMMPPGMLPPGQGPTSQ